MTDMFNALSAQATLCVMSDSHMPRDNSHFLQSYQLTFQCSESNLVGRCMHDIVNLLNKYVHDLIEVNHRTGF